jgi:hypothetical protein
MQSMKERNSFRAFVPLILNGRVVQWYYTSGENSIRLEVNVRHYTKRSDIWFPKGIIVEFDKCCKTHQPYKTKDDESQERVMEYFYSCDTPKITFDTESIPRIVE